MGEEERLEGKKPSSDVGKKSPGWKFWVAISAAVLAAAAALVLIWVLPASDVDADEEETGMAQQVDEEVMEDGEPDTSSGDREVANEVTTVPGEGEEDPSGFTLEFPEPVDGVDEIPTEGGYTEIAGHWILDMAGLTYGLENCHLFLDGQGHITSPEDYDNVFEIMESEYRWEEGSPSFESELQLVVKLGSDQVAVPVKMELRGTVSDSLSGVEGDFSAVPLGEAFAVYTEQGRFTMRRVNR